MELSLQQEKVVSYHGYLIVKAPPGSGKTFTLVSKIERVQKKSSKKIIALTFSNKAAEELKLRIANQENVVVGTIHAFCQDLVMSRGYQVGLPEDLNVVSDEADKLFVIKEVINNNILIKNKIKDLSDEYFKKVLSFIKKQKENFINPINLLNSDNVNSELHYEIYNSYNNKMISQKLIDFDDLLYYAYLILSKDETRNLFSRLYGHLYVDEAQDLNMPQYQIIKTLASFVDDVMLIGDPSQAIYRFMGSNRKVMEEIFKRDFNADVIELNENYRSAKKIVRLINLLKDETESLSKYPLDGELTYNQYDNEEEEAINIVEKIKSLVETEKLKYEDIAILGRNNYLFSNIIKLLQVEKIPFNFGAHGNTDMETEEGKILLEYIKLLSNPLNERIRNDFQNYLLLENNDMNLISEALKLKYPNISEIAEKSMKSDLIFQKEVEKYIDKITNSSQINDDDKYMLINDMKVFLDNWKNFLKRSKVREKNLKSFINDFIMGKTFNFSFDGLSLLTVHKSKGLEFDTTFVIGLNEGTLPDYRATKDEDMVEEDNNAYVALSRAKRRCYISSTRLKMMPWGKSKIQNESRYVTVIKKAVN